MRNAECGFRKKARAFFNPHSAIPDPQSLLAFPSFDCRFVGRFREQLADSPLKSRMQKLRCQLCQRGEHEAAHVQARVRELEKFGCAQLIAVQQQIKINRPRAAPLLAPAPQRVLDSEQPRQHLFGREDGYFQFRNHIEKGWLLAHVHRLCFIN